MDHERRRSSSLVPVLLILGMSGRAASAWASDDNRIMVPPPVGVAEASAQEALLMLETALREHFGNAIVPAADAIEAQQRLKISPSELLKAEGVALLARDLRAQRAVVFSSTQKGATAMIYANIGAGVTRIIALGPVRLGRLNERQASRIATRIVKKAGVLLNPPPSEETLTLDLGEVSIGGDNTDASSKPTQIFAGLETTTTPGPPSNDILAEERREALLREQRTAARHRVPSLALAVGMGLGSRSVEINGSQSFRILPIDSGLLPAWSVYASVRPLKLFTALNRTPLADLILDAHFRRGLFDAAYGELPLKIQDDDLSLRLSYRTVLLSHRYSPHLGLGLGGGWERTEFSGGLPVASARYIYGELHARVMQPVWRPYLESEGLVALRQVAGDRSTVYMQPAWSTELWLVARLQPVLYGRLGFRTSHFGAWRDAAMQLSDQRTIFEFQVGGYF